MINTTDILPMLSIVLIHADTIALFKMYEIHRQTVYSFNIVTIFRVQTDTDLTLRRTRTIFQTQKPIRSRHQCQLWEMLRCTRQCYMCRYMSGIQAYLQAVVRSCNNCPGPERSSTSWCLCRLKIIINLRMC